MKMLHVTIKTNRFEEEVKFYQEKVGLTLMRDLRPSGRQFAFLADQMGDTEIEIIGDPEAENAGNANLSIGFDTGDAETAWTMLRAFGVEVSDMVEPQPGVKFFFVTDPAGVTVQFM